MDTEQIMHMLENSPAQAAALVSGLSDEQARRRPQPQDWSILEIVNHLADEERYDFRVRIDTILNRPGEEPPSINPEGWVTEHAYHSRGLAESLQDFTAERQKSLVWLRGLEAPDWELTYTASWGSIRAGDIFAAWAAHDLIHLRDLTMRLWALLGEAAAPYSTEYAGEW